MIANERKSVLSLAMLYATRMLGLFMVLPVFVLYGEDYAGATPALIGLAIGAYGLSQALLQIPFGALSDRIGRKPMLYIGLLIFFLGSVIAASSDTIYGVIVGRFIQGAGAIASVIMALLSDLTSEESRTKAMAFVGMSIGISFTLALILGPLVAEFGGLQAIFWLTAVLALMALCWSFIAIPTPAVLTKHRDSRVFKDQLGSVLRDQELLRLDFGIFVLHLVLTALFVAIPFSLVERVGFAANHHWWLYLSVLLGSFVCMVPFIVYGEKKQKMKPVFCFAIATLAASSFAISAVGESFGLFVFAMFFFFMGFNLLEASLPSLVSKISPAGVKGTAMGVYSTSQFLGAFIGGVAGGFLLAWYDEHAIYLFSSVLVCVWLAIAFTMPNPKHEKTLTVYFDDQLHAAQLDQLGLELIGIDGVEDAVVVSDGIAYLKVLSGQYDASAIERLKQRYTSSEHA